MDNLLDKIVYNSEVMQQVRKDLGPFVVSGAPILFWGETECGMGFYAKTVHEASGRTGKFLQIPGFSLDEDTVKQQFLGSDEQSGWLEDANNGTIFVKRISEMSPGVQQTLLHLVGSQSVDGRIQFPHRGKTEPVKVNVRFIFSVAHDLRVAIHDELVSRELIDEIKRRGKIIHLPPLRERKEDILSIAKNFFEEFNAQYQQKISEIDEKAGKFLINYVWPGNVNELKQVIEQIFINYPGISIIKEEHIPDHIKKPAITGGKYSFKLKNDMKFTGKILSPLLKIQTENKKMKLNTGDLAEITRVEDPQFIPPKFKHFIFKFKDGSQIAGQILDKKMRVETSFDSNYQITPQDLYFIYLA